VPHPQAHFFNSLCDVASPAAPGQFSAFLQLVAEFAPLMISHEEREELRRSIAKEQQGRHKRKRALSKSYDDEGMMDLEGSSQGTEPHQAEQGGDHSKKARTAAAAAAELEFGEEQLKEGGSTTTDGISFIAWIFLRLAEMLVSAVAYLSSSSAGYRSLSVLCSNARAPCVLCCVWCVWCACVWCVCGI
jgi:hypothetical protein